MTPLNGSTLHSKDEVINLNAVDSNGEYHSILGTNPEDGNKGYQWANWGVHYATTATITNKTNSDVYVALTILCREGTHIAWVDDDRKISGQVSGNEGDDKQVIVACRLVERGKTVQMSVANTLGGQSNSMVRKNLYVAEDVNDNVKGFCEGENNEILTF